MGKPTYKQALNMFCNNYCGENDGINDCVNQCICRDVLEEAVMKAELHTPKKPNWQGDEKCMDAYCPNCGAYLDDDETPCEACTQHIDWGEGE